MEVPPRFIKSCGKLRGLTKSGISSFRPFFGSKLTELTKLFKLH